MNVIELLDAGVCVRVVQTLLHFLWQGLLIAVVVAAVNVAARRKSAVFRYRVATAAMLLMATCLPVTFLALAPETLPVVEQPRPSRATSEVSGSGNETIVDAPVSPENVPLAVAPHMPEPASNAVGWPLQTPTEFWVSASPYIVTTYLAGVLLMMTRLAFAFAGGERLRRSAAPIEDATLLKMFADKAKRFGMCGIPAIRCCERVATPIIVGVFKPTILLPVCIMTELSPAQLEAVLAHELAHIRRWDHVANVIQRIIESLLFFHPAVWYVSRCVSKERENCCDDMVVAHGTEATRYAELLVRISELSQSWPVPSAATLAATGGKPTRLRQRVLRLLGDPVHTHLRLRSVVASAAVVTVSIIAIGVLCIQAAGVADRRLDDFELLPSKERHKFFFNAVSVPPPLPQLGVTVERHLHSGLSFIDLETGQTAVAPSFPRGETLNTGLGDWARNQGMDGTLWLSTVDDHVVDAAIQGIDLFGAPAPDIHWDQLTADELDKRLEEAWRESRQVRGAKSLAKLRQRGEDPRNVVWLFETREGTRGILQITEFTDEPQGFKLRYKLMNHGLKPGKTVHRWIGDQADRNAKSYLDLETGRVASLPAAFYDSTPPGRDAWRWQDAEGMDVIGDIRDGLLGLKTRFAKVSGEWDDITASQLADALEGLRGDSEGLFLLSRITNATTGLRRDESEIHAFRTSAGAIGIIQIVEIDQKTRRQQVRYKLVAQVVGSVPDATNDEPPANGEDKELIGAWSGGQKELQRLVLRADGTFDLSYPKTPRIVDVVPESGVWSRGGKTLTLDRADKKRFLIQSDPIGSSTQIFYGPFDGDPRELLNLSEEEAEGKP